MSHVDDGILHAYLDGALQALSDAGELPDGMTEADVRLHLGTCADCRARLEAERAVREGAGAVLGDLPIPGHYVPALPALNMTRPRRVRRVPLGWAASVILALGAGWMGSEVWRAQHGSTQEASAFRSSPQSAAPPAESFEAHESAAGSESSDASAAQQSGTDVVANNDLPAREPDAVAGDGAGAARAPVAVSPDPPAGAPAAPPAGAPAAPPVGAPAAPPPGMAPAAAAAPAAAGTGASRSAVAEGRITADVERPHIMAIRSDSLSARMRSVSDTDARVDAATGARSGGALAPLGRAFVAGDDTSGPPAWPDARMNLVDARNVLGAGLHQRVAFDSIIAREQTGRIRFADATSSDLSALADQLFVIRDASTTSIEAALEPGQTVVRVRQTMRTVPVRSAESSAMQVELITWRQASVPLNELVVTASRSEARSRQDARQAATVQMVWPGIDRLADGRREIVLGTHDGAVWIALRARLDEDELRALASRVTIR